MASGDKVKTRRRRSVARSTNHVPELPLKGPARHFVSQHSALRIHSAAQTATVTVKPPEHPWLLQHFIAVLPVANVITALVAKGKKCLYFTTLSEPAIKMLRY